MTQLAGVKIYLVDDDEAVRDSLSTVLSTYGAEVDTFESVAAARSAPFDARSAFFILDVQLPDGNGIDLLGQLRARGLHYPAIFITGEGSSTFRAALGRTDAIALIDKPFDGEVIAEMIADALAAGRDCSREGPAG